MIIFTIILRAPAYAEPQFPLTWLGDDIFGALGIMAFAFTCSQVAFNNYLTMGDQSADAWRSTTRISTTMSWAIPITFAVVGFVCFGPNVQPNLFMNFASDDLCDQHLSLCPRILHDVDYPVRTFILLLQGRLRLVFLR